MSGFLASLAPRAVQEASVQQSMVKRAHAVPFLILYFWCLQSAVW